MTNKSKEKAQQNADWKPNPKVTIRLKQGDDNDWSSNENVVMQESYW